MTPRPRVAIVATGSELVRGDRRDVHGEVRPLDPRRGAPPHGLQAEHPAFREGERAGPVLGRFGAISARMVALELMRWRITGGQVLFIRPNTAVGAIAGTKMKGVLDPAIHFPAVKTAHSPHAWCKAGSSLALRSSIT